VSILLLASPSSPGQCTLSYQLVAEAEDDNTAVAHFEFDLATPFFQQLMAVFDALGTSPLGSEQLGQLESHQGVYGLYRHNALVYVGKADNPLPDRLNDHLIKLDGRLNIAPDEMRFKAVYLAKTWVPLAPEAMMISHFRGEGLCEWNGNGFGPHDPGRNRERTNKPPEGFDANYPIKADWPCKGIEARRYEANSLLQKIKSLLPFCFRYETDRPKSWRKGSLKYNGKQIDVPRPGMPAADLIANIARQLGPSWQATKFSSHMILYEENAGYTFGTRL
jgi:hypothetical protein